MAADVDEDACELRSDRSQRAMHALARGDDVVLELEAEPGPGAAASAHGRPVRRHPRGQACEPEVGAQALAGLELGVPDHGGAVLVLAPAQPRQRALRRVEFGLPPRSRRAPNTGSGGAGARVRIRRRPVLATAQQPL
jgi:hypothetical protein